MLLVYLSYTNCHTNIWCQLFLCRSTSRHTVLHNYAMFLVHLSYSAAQLHDIACLHAILQAVTRYCCRTNEQILFANEQSWQWQVTSRGQSRPSHHSSGRMYMCIASGCHASWLNSGHSLIYFSKISSTWKLLENEIGLGKPWKLKCRVLESLGIFNCGSN